MNVWQFLEKKCETCSTILIRRKEERKFDFIKKRFCFPCLKKNQSETSKRNVKNKPTFTDSNLNRQRRYTQIKLEVGMAKNLETEGFRVFSPTVVCDRIAVKNGKVYFVEFKKPGQKLRPGQQEIHDLVPEMYIIRYL
jgi:hypothetical protein